MAKPAIRYRPPAPSLRAFITTYYWVDVPRERGTVTDWLHPEWPNIRFSLEGSWRTDVAGRMSPTPRAALFGPTCRAVQVEGTPTIRLVGLGLLPLGFAALFDTDAAAIRHDVVALEDGWPSVQDLLAGLEAAADDDVQAALLNTFFEARAALRPPPPDLLRRAHAALLDPDTTTVLAFAQALDTSPRHLLRLCLRLFGFPPKLLLRRQRFLRTLEAALAAPDSAFAQVLDDAYYDQSHFVRDFHQFMGLSPTAYFQLQRPLLTMVQRERLKTLGASFQGLHAERMRQARPESVSSKPALHARA